MSNVVVMPDLELTPWRNAIAGALGACFANTCVYPLDIIKTRMQVQQPRNDGEKVQFNTYRSVLHAFRKIILNEGVHGLYVGLFGSLIGVVTTSFAYFYMYTTIRNAYRRRNARIGTFMELLIGALAGCLAQTLTLPISVSTTRQQTSSPQDRLNFGDTVREIIYEDGFTGLWHGLVPSLVLSINPAITYGLFERLKSTLILPNARLSPKQSFFIGAISKTVATVVTYPYIMAKVIMQQSPSNLKQTDTSYNPRKDAPLKILARLFAKGGFHSWYKGLMPQLFKAVLTQAILFSSKEIFVQYTLMLIAIYSKFRRSRVEWSKIK